jgi:IS30 family transposase
VDTVREAFERKRKLPPDRLRRTAVFDDGKEFAEHQRPAAAVGLKMCFAEPCSALQRGTDGLSKK